MDFNLSVALTISAWAIRLVLMEDLTPQVRIAHRLPCGSVVVYYDTDGWDKMHDVWPGDEQSLWRPVDSTELEARFSKVVPA